MPTTPWLSSFLSNPQADLRLFCFPYAGASSVVFREWPAYLPRYVEVCPVQLTGRGRRLKEELYTRMPPLVHAAAEALQPYLDKPFVFFGHSLGALIGFEIARWLRNRGRPEPLHLVVSGRRAPQLPSTEPTTYNLPEAEFIEDLRRLNGTPHEVLGNVELMALTIPLLRADFQLAQTYTYTDEPPLNCSITAFSGLEDEKGKREHMEEWRKQTTASFSLRMFPGDHFYLNSARPQLLHALSQELNKQFLRSIP
jgi:medium-chain acyl-[acyl-carrier-protein] hydrolase